MGLRSTCTDYLIAKLAGQRQIRKPIAMHVAHLLPTVAVLGAAEAVRNRLDSWPGNDCIPDQLTSSSHC